MKKSLGTISALAALCAGSQTSEAAVTVSSTIDNNVVVSSSGDNTQPISVIFDFDGDAVSDFQITSPANDSILYITPLNGREIVADSATSGVKSLQIGDVIGNGLQSYIGAGNHILHSPVNAAASVIEEGTIYIGFHYPGLSGYIEGWVRLDTTLSGAATYDESGDSIIAVSSQWESTQNGSITIVPEPSSSLFVMAGLTSLIFRRRRQD